MDEFERQMTILRGIASGFILAAIGAVLLTAGEMFGVVMLIFAGALFATSVGAWAEKKKGE